MGGGGGNMIEDTWNDIQESASDLERGIREDPLRAAGYLFPLVSGGLQPTRDAGVHIRDDQRAQAEGEAAKEQARADQAIAQARADAENSSAKQIDPLVLERRRRAAAAGSRAGSILTGGSSLGAADVATKTLLGL